MQLIVNGKSQSHPDGMTIAEFLAALEMNPRLVAVEVNRQLVTRGRHEETTLGNGDELEIVTLVGGG
jgi:thiamine biosynthesis protein ThiS